MHPMENPRARNATKKKFEVRDGDVTHLISAMGSLVMEVNITAHGNQKARAEMLVTRR